jgi:hypothetical protein
LIYPTLLMIGFNQPDMAEAKLRHTTAPGQLQQF